MAVRLEPNIFKALANFNPARLQDAGGATCPMLELLHDLACQQAGLDAGAAVHVRLADAPDGWIFFGDREMLGLAKDTPRWQTLVVTSDGLSVIHRYRPEDGHNLVPPEGKVADPVGFHVEQGQRIGGLLSNRPLSWPTYTQGGNYWKGRA